MHLLLIWKLLGLKSSLLNKNVCIFYRWTHRNTVLVKHEHSSCHFDKSWKKMLWIQFNWYLEFSMAFLSHTVESPFLHDTWVKLLSSEKEVFYCFYWYNFTFNCQQAAGVLWWWKHCSKLSSPSFPQSHVRMCVLFKLSDSHLFQVQFFNLKANNISHQYRRNQPIK